METCQSLSCAQLFVTPWTAACQAPLFMEFSRQEHWSGLPFPSLQLCSRHEQMGCRWGGVVLNRIEQYSCDDLYLAKGSRNRTGAERGAEMFLDSSK